MTQERGAETPRTIQSIDQPPDAQLLINTLYAKLAESQAEARRLLERVVGLIDDRVIAEARCREFESDARRYRWLRDECDAISNPGATWILDAPPDMWDDGIDAAIDAATAREGESHE